MVLDTYHHNVGILFKPSCYYLYISLSLEISIYFLSANFADCRNHHWTLSVFQVATFAILSIKRILVSTIPSTFSAGTLAGTL
jgi:hypothetical protein